MKTTELAAILPHCSTPCYLFDIPVVKERVSTLRRHLPDGVRLCYAMKANPFLVSELSDSVDRFEVCSPGEYHICQEQRIPPKQLVISGVHKSKAEIAEMVKEHPDMVFTAESMHQFLLLEQAARQNQTTLRILLRLTSGNQFGMEEELLKAIIRNRASYPDVHIAGIQFFSGTQKYSLKRLGRELNRLVLLLETLKAEYQYQAEEVEFGTGFPVSYFQEEAFDEDAFLENFSQLLLPLCPKAAVTLEIGRSIAASCGIYLTSVVDIKQNKGENYLILDGGIHQLSYYGQTMAMKVPYFQVIPKREGLPQKWNLCGSLCTVNDLLVKQLPLCSPRLGDVFAFENVGAYSITEGLSLFLSRDLPSVYFVKDNGELKAVRGHIPTYPMNQPNQKE